MALYGYVRKSKPAMWTQAFPGQVKIVPKHAKAGREPRRIAQKSQQQRARDVLYEKAVKAWWPTVKDGECPVAAAWLVPYGQLMNRPHHIRGHVGTLYWDTRFFLACSWAGHQWIHDHIKEAIELGWIGGACEWGCPVPME